MATRFYIDAVAVPTISPTFSGSWEQTTEMVRRCLTTVSHASGQAEATVASAETSASAAFDVGLLQGISPPLAAQTIAAAGTVSGQMRFSESDLAANMSFTGSVKVFDGTGTTARGTLLTSAASVTEFATSLTNIKCPASSTMTAVTAQDGDVIVWEIAVRCANTDIASYTATASYGRGAATDLPVNETETGALNPWLEFSQNLIFMPDPAGGFDNSGGKFTSQIEQGTGTAGAALTVTLPAVAGRKHAITSIDIHRAATAAVAGDAALYISTMNLQDMGWAVGNAMAAGGTQKDVSLKFPGHPLMCDRASTPTVIACPAPGAATLWSVRVAYQLVP